MIRLLFNLERDCGQPPDGEFTVRPFTTARSFGDQFTYACLEGYEPEASLTATCKADGKWSVGNKGPVCAGNDI